MHRKEPEPFLPNFYSAYLCRARGVDVCAHVHVHWDTVCDFHFPHHICNNHKHLITHVSSKKNC